jgi:hypothetical protein
MDEGAGIGESFGRDLSTSMGSADYKPVPHYLDRMFSSIIAFSRARNSSPFHSEREMCCELSRMLYVSQWYTTRDAANMPTLSG